MNQNLYKRPSKPLYIPVNKRAHSFNVTTPEVQIMSVHTSTECHVTPPEVADRMAGYLNLDDDYCVLDPQAGTGNLTKACFDQGYSIHVTAIELNTSLFEATAKRLKDHSAEFINRCFLEYASHPRRKPYERIITNPPFSAVKKHINACLDLLADDGVMVALVPVTFCHPNAEHLEDLPRDCFALTAVSTKLIRFFKSELI